MATNLPLIRTSLCLIFGVCSCSAPLASAKSKRDAAIQAAVAKDYDGHLANLFDHFHRNPELSYREFETAKRIADELEAAGVKVTRNVGGTGVVGILENGKGPTVLLRADMDGLPVKEKSGLANASTRTQEDIDGVVKPVMHACGHDVHITALVGTARRLVALRRSWRGRVMFIAQPAEERIGGAKAMVEDKLYERFGRPDYGLAFHVAAGRPAGKLLIAPGVVASSSDSVNVTMFGVGAHGASPHRGKDPIYMASQFVVALQSVVSREIAPLQPGVITVGSIHGGFKHNIIPDRVELQITVRSDDEATRKNLIDGIKRVARGVAVTSGLPENLMPKVEVGFESTPVMVNDHALTARVRKSFVRAFGKDRLFAASRDGMGAEDFPYFTNVEPPIPGAYFAVGGTPQKDLDAAANGGPPVASHHSPLFKIAPEPSVTTGVSAMTVAVIDLLRR